MISKILNLLYSEKKKKSPLKTELDNLKKKIEQEDNRLALIEKEFWANGGICCPYCGVLGYTDARQRQTNREQRVDVIEKKLKLSSLLTKRQRLVNRIAIKRWLVLPNDLQPLGVDIFSRYAYLAKRFDIHPNHMNAYSVGKMGIKAQLELEMAEWCEANQDFQLPVEKRTSYA